MMNMNNKQKWSMDFRWTTTTKIVKYSTSFNFFWGVKNIEESIKVKKKTLTMTYISIDICDDIT